MVQCRGYPFVQVLVALFESMHRTVSQADLETLVRFTEELCAATTVTASERQTDCQQTLVTALQNKVTCDKLPESRFILPLPCYRFVTIPNFAMRCVSRYLGHDAIRIAILGSRCDTYRESVILVYQSLYLHIFFYEAWQCNIIY